ncbi:alpha-keto acid decarboxylase family protein [Rouxiella sp. T17]|uniref:alpha-keto acid decarboxylase family protein n=1 Tax=Rouxiella sp. T17 TaxID=3085684 RepID=UPI002FC62F53
MNNVCSVGDYLVERLSQLGIDELFGVPGDYNLQFLDSVIAHPRLKWIGCSNELNAAYGADGYGRSKPAAALLTTFGVGELSALNGIAGSYAEYVPVIHIVGAPALSAQNNHELLHHSLGDGDFNHFARMSAHITVAQAMLTRENATSEIDRVLREALYARRPVYIQLPSDVAAYKVTLPAEPLRLSQPPVNEQAVADFTEAAAALLKPAKRVSLLADFLADRFGARADVQKWVDEVPLPHATLLLGKGLLNEQHPRFCGTYSGQASSDALIKVIEDAEAIITVGVCFSDTVTSGFTQNIAPQKRIDLQPFSAQVGDKLFDQLPLRVSIEILHHLTAELAPYWRSPVLPDKRLIDPSESGLSQQAFWQQMQSFLQPGDIIVAEQGTACFGAAQLTLPKGCDFIAQPLWGSIGFTLPAALGAQIAFPERRVVLIIGDGSAQLTVQALGAAIRYDLKTVIFILNNDGYTVERAIHGAEQPYNDIAQWQWTLLPQAFGAVEPTLVEKVTEVKQLQQVMAKISAEPQLSWVEVVLPKMDVPPLLRAVTRALEEHNSSRD